MARERQLPDWINAYTAHMRAKGVPEIYARWTAISIIGGAMEQKVWHENNIGRLYPNTYVIIIGESGVGKTINTNDARLRWSALSRTAGHSVAPSSLTAASLIDALEDAHRVVKHDELPAEGFNSLLLPVNELPVLMSKYDEELLANMTDLYDCHCFVQRRRGGDLFIDVENPQLHMLAAIPPTVLSSILPESAWESGFVSRLLFIYSSERRRRSMFGRAVSSDTKAKERDNALASDLRQIAKLVGRVEPAPEMAEAFDAWALEGGCAPEPSHPKLTTYCTRRDTHLMKICMAVCASEGNDLRITHEHFIRALDYLHNAEDQLTAMFKAMTHGGDGATIKAAMHFVNEHFQKTGKPVPESWVISILIRHTSDTWRVAHLLKAMIDGGHLKIAPPAVPPPNRKFIPIPHAGD